MPDQANRALERQAAQGDRVAEADLLRARARVLPDLWVDQECGGLLHIASFSSDPDPSKRAMGAEGGSCELCGGTGRERVAMPWEQRWALAAYSGHEASRLLVPVWLDEPKSGWHVVDSWDLGVFTSGLSRWQGALLRAAVAAARAAMGWKVDHDADFGWKGSPELAAIESAESWLARPCEKHREAWQVAWDETNGDDDWLPAPHHDLQSGWTIRSAAREASEPVVRAAICKALVTWVLQREGKT